jgi:hypothetical protein
MNRFLLCGFLLCSLELGSLSIAQQTKEPTVSGPAQEKPGGSTGKSYKAGSKRKTIKKKNPSTGQTRRLGNTGRLTKNGSNSGSSNKSDSTPQPK